MTVDNEREAVDQPRDDLREFFAYRVDPTAQRRNEIVTRHLPLARAIALRFARRGEPLDDLVQVASFGLIKSVERFDPTVGTSFAGFAIPTMVGEIKRHFRDRTWPLHVGRPTKDLLPQLRDATDQLAVQLSRSPSATEVAQLLEVSVDTVLHALEARSAYRTTSLNATADGSDRSTRPDLGSIDPELIAVIDRHTVTGLLERLPDRERRVVELRYFAELSQSEIATQVGISQMHVSRLLRKAIARLERPNNTSK